MEGTNKTDLYYGCHRHEYFGFQGKSSPTLRYPIQTLKQQSVRTKVVVTAMCLNLGRQPPNMKRDENHAHQECFIDTLSAMKSETMDQIGKAIQRQYQMSAVNYHARYMLLNDTTPDLLKSALSHARSACDSRKSTTRPGKAEHNRVILHYNGHAVPPPSENGELWLFNDKCTKYMPVHLIDLWAAMQSGATAFVFDCNNAGRLKVAFSNILARQTRTQKPVMHLPIAFFSCGADEELPSTKGLPADLFTSCMTHPLKTSLRWRTVRIGQSPLTPQLSVEDVDTFPGNIKERKTPLGELHWCLMAILDTICYDALAPPLFAMLCRSDAMMASLTRNFHLARFLMRQLRANPVSMPSMPATHDHPLWSSWLSTIDYAVSVLPTLNAEIARLQAAGHDLTSAMNLTPSCLPGNRIMQQLSLRYTVYGRQQELTLNSDVFSATTTDPVAPLPDRRNQKLFFPFFADQLAAFETWLQQADSGRAPPPQLPIILQVMLSQSLRVRALVLISRFLDLGGWAIQQANNIDMHAYMLALLYPTVEVENRHLLVFVWAKVIAADPTAHTKLVLEKKVHFFAETVTMDTTPADRRYLSLFVLGTVAARSSSARDTLIAGGTVGEVLRFIHSGYPVIRIWALIVIGALIGAPSGLAVAHQNRVFEAVCGSLVDAVPEVRAAALYVLGNLVPAVTEGPVAPELGRQRVTVALAPLAKSRKTRPRTAQARPFIPITKLVDALLPTIDDAAPIVRHELLRVTSLTIRRFPDSSVQGTAATLCRAMALDPVDTPARAPAESHSWVDINAGGLGESPESKTPTPTPAPAPSVAAFSGLYSILRDLSVDGVPAIAAVAHSARVDLEALALVALVAERPETFPKVQLPADIAPRRPGAARTKRPRVVAELTEAELATLVAQTDSEHRQRLLATLQTVEPAIVDLVSATVTTPLLLMTNLHAASLAAFRQHREARRCPVHAGVTADGALSRAMQAIPREQCPRCRFLTQNASLLAVSANAASGYTYGVGQTTPYTIKDGERMDASIARLRQKVEDCGDVGKTKLRKKLEKELLQRSTSMARSMKTMNLEHAFRSRQLGDPAMCQFPTMGPASPTPAHPTLAQEDPASYWTREPDALTTVTVEVEPMPEEVLARALYHFCYRLNDGSSMPYSLPGDSDWMRYHTDIAREKDLVNSRAMADPDSPESIARTVELCSGDHLKATDLPEQVTFGQTFENAINEAKLRWETLDSVKKTRFSSTPHSFVSPAAREHGVSAIVFHPVLPRLITASTQHITVWDTSAPAGTGPVNTVKVKSIGQAPDRRRAPTITGVHVMNPNCPRSMLVAVGTDCTVRVIGDYDGPHGGRLVSAFAVARPPDAPMTMTQHSWLSGVAARPTPATGTLTSKFTIGQSLNRATSIVPAKVRHLISGRSSGKKGQGSPAPVLAGAPASHPSFDNMAVLIGSTGSDLSDLTDGSHTAWGASRLSMDGETIPQRARPTRATRGEAAVSSVLRGRHLFVGHGNTVTSWDLRSERRAVMINAGITKAVTGVSVADDRVAASIDGTVRIYDLRGSSARMASEVNHLSSHVIIGAALSHIDRDKLIYGTPEGEVVITDLRAPTAPLMTFAAHPQSGLASIALHPLTPIIATGSGNSFVKIWDYGGALLGQMTPEAVAIIEDGKEVKNLAWHPLRADLTFTVPGSEVIRVYRERD